MDIRKKSLKEKNPQEIARGNDEARAKTDNKPKKKDYKEKKRHLVHPPQRPAQVSGKETAYKWTKQPKKLRAVPGQFSLIHYRKTKNNSFCTISNLFGQQKTLWSISSGQIPKKSTTQNCRKTRYSQNMMLKRVVAKLLSLGRKYLVIHCDSKTTSKRYLFKNFKKNFRILLLKDLTGIPHNGCRAPAARRL
jgi:ribosomal protein S11